MRHLRTMSERRGMRGGRAGAVLLAAACSLGSLAATAAAAEARPAYDRPTQTAATPNILGGGNGLITAGHTVEALADSWPVPQAYASSQIQFHADGSGTVDTLSPIRFGIDPTVGVRDEAFSPSGKKVAIVGDVAPNDMGLWIANADGIGAPVRLDGGAGPVNFYSYPRFSPDGTRVYFMHLNLPAGTSGTDTVGCLKTDGSGDCGATGLEGLTTAAYAFGVTNAGDVYFTHNDATPGGTQSLLWNHTTNTVTVIDALQDAAVSPDGTQLVYKKPGSQQIYLRALGTAPGVADRALTNVPARTQTTVPAWSPDGTQLAFAAQQIGTVPNPGSAEVSVVPVAGGTGYTLGTGDQGQFYGSPYWEPATVAAQHPAIVPYVGDQVGGADRYLTAIDASKLAWQAASTTSLTAAPHAKIAVLARGDTYADALAGSAMAAELGGPLLLTPPDALDPNVRDELRRLLSAGRTVYLLGGPMALSPSVEDSVRALGLSPQRLQGADRFGTSIAIAQKIGQTGHPVRVLVATGTNYPDALVAGSTAAAAHGLTTVVLTDGTVMPKVTRDYLEAISMPIAAPAIEIYGIGGPGYTAAASALGGRVFPLFGNDRYATASAVAGQFFHDVDEPKSIGIAFGGNWPDALSGGALVGLHYGPLLLEDGATLPGGQLTYLRKQGGAVTSVVAFGGLSVMPRGPITAAMNAANSAAHWQYAFNRVDIPLP